MSGKAREKSGNLIMTGEWAPSTKYNMVDGDKMTARN